MTKYPRSNWSCHDNDIIIFAPPSLIWNQANSINQLLRPYAIGDRILEEHRALHSPKQNGPPDSPAHPESRQAFWAYHLLKAHSSLGADHERKL